MNYHQCKNDMYRLISSPKGCQSKHQERKDDIREWPQVEHGNISCRRRNEKIQIVGQL